MTSMNIHINEKNTELLEAMPSSRLQFKNFAVKHAVYSLATILATVCPETGFLNFEYNGFKTQIQAYTVDWCIQKPEVHVRIPMGFLEQLRLTLTEKQTDCMIINCLKKFFHDHIKISFIPVAYFPNHNIKKLPTPLNNVKIPLSMDFSLLHPICRPDSCTDKETTVNIAKRCNKYRQKITPDHVTGWGEKVFISLTQTQLQQHQKQSEILETFRHFSLREHCMITPDGHILHKCIYCKDAKRNRFMLHVPYLVCTGCFSHEPVNIPPEMVQFMTFKWCITDVVNQVENQQTNAQKFHEHSYHGTSKKFAIVPTECNDISPYHKRVYETAMDAFLKKTGVSAVTQTDLCLLYEKNESSSESEEDEQTVEGALRKLYKHRHCMALKKVMAKKTDL